MIYLTDKFKAATAVPEMEKKRGKNILKITRNNLFSQETKQADRYEPKGYKRQYSTWFISGREEVISAGILYLLRSNYYFFMKKK